MQANTLLANKAFDADERLIEPFLAASKSPVIPSRSGKLESCWINYVRNRQ